MGIVLGTAVGMESPLTTPTPKQTQRVLNAANALGEDIRGLLLQHQHQHQHQQHQRQGVAGGTPLCTSFLATSSLSAASTVGVVGAGKPPTPATTGAKGGGGGKGGEAATPSTTLSSAGGKDAGDDSEEEVPRKEEAAAAGRAMEAIARLFGDGGGHTTCKELVAWLWDIALTRAQNQYN